ncbi:hypothetical protein A7K91_00115 [Paenibacillus oryzae]|uniref:HTH crp-type domain-containing protein n=1 Tax=Paenibacillus oryzae TaxID=1844972 RepID=A0A1A5YMF6_9BACL|nr:helix-turn-helix domain-containing protein [Paenibacillus oryzae]OBR66723.1 hypothetical protein A7K91_00115 [Paenibacillus oryzae]
MSTARVLLDEADKRLKRRRANRVIDGNGEERTDCIVITPEMQEAARRRKEIETYRNGWDIHFTMVHMEGARDLLAKEILNTKELGYFLMLQSYIDYKNMLKIKTFARLPMTKKELAEVLGIRDKRTYSKLLDKFMELGLIHSKKITLFKQEYNAFYINENYCLRGSSRTNKLVKVFIEAIHELYSQKDIKPADIGFLYRILPYMHYESNHLVRHPYEQDFAYAEALSLRDIVEITGMDESNVKEHLRIKLSGVHVFGSFKAGRNSVYKVNPSLFYRGIAPELVKSDFTLTKQSR